MPYAFGAKRCRRKGIYTVKIQDKLNLPMKGIYSLACLTAFLFCVESRGLNGYIGSFEELKSTMEKGGIIRLNYDTAILFQESIQVTVDVEIDGMGHSVSFVGAGSNRFFTIKNARLKLTGISFEKGQAPIDENTFEAYGGAIDINSGTLLLDRCVFALNRADGRVGKIIPPNVNSPFYEGKAGGGGFGGAISAVNATIDIRESEFRENSISAASAIAQYVNWNGQNWAYADGARGFGAAIWTTNSTLSIEACRFIGNAGTNGSQARGSNIPQGFGGAIYLGGGSLEIQASHFIGNSFIGGSGGALGLNGNSKIVASFFISNTARGQPPNTVSFPDTQPRGAGGAVFATAPVIINESCFASNKVHGSGYTTVDGRDVYPKTSYGGAIASTTQLSTTNCIFLKNSAFGGTGAPFAANIEPSLYHSPYGFGGAIAALSNGIAYVTHATFGSNSVQRGEIPNITLLPLGSAIFLNESAYMGIKASIVDGHTAQACSDNVTDLGWNVGSNSGLFSHVTSVNTADLKLQYPLSGFPPFIAPRRGSPAIDLVTSPVSPADVRGGTRPSQRGDSGAFEQEYIQPLTIAIKEPGWLQIGAGLSGWPLKIETSEDLKSWTPTAETGLSGDLNQSLTATSALPSLFFRVVPE
jgi:hypothetical protein